MECIYCENEFCDDYLGEQGIWDLPVETSKNVVCEGCGNPNEFNAIQNIKISKGQCFDCCMGGDDCELKYFDKEKIFLCSICWEERFDAKCVDCVTGDNDGM